MATLFRCDFAGWRRPGRRIPGTLSASKENIRPAVKDVNRGLQGSLWAAGYRRQMRQSVGQQRRGRLPQIRNQRTGNGAARNLNGDEKISFVISFERELKSHLENVKGFSA